MPNSLLSKTGGVIVMLTPHVTSLLSLLYNVRVPMFCHLGLPHQSKITWQYKLVIRALWTVGTLAFAPRHSDRI
jgi:hypothetical protein